MEEFKILNRKIGFNHLPVIISEIGINHNGSLKEAKKIVDAAYNSGVEIIKHQTHVVDDEYAPIAKKIKPGNSKDSIYDIISKCALSEEDEFALKNYIEKKGIIFLSTPFSKKAVDRLENFGVKAYKIGSGECNNFELLEYVASKKKPIILSTGMNDIKSIKKSAKVIRKYDVPFALLHCTNIYPTPPHLVRLGALNELQKEFPNTVIGLSDHTVSNYTCLAAVGLGASIIEKHFTDSKKRKGPDIICSMSPEDFIDLKNGTKVIFEARGGKKGLLEEEKVTANFAFASVVAVKDIKIGEKLDKFNICLKRPGIGDFNAEHYNELIGKKVNCNIAAGDLIKKEDF